MEINGIKYELPRGWKDIRLSTYFKLIDVLNKEYENDITKTVNILSVLTSIPVDEILKDEVSKFIEIQRKLTFLSEVPKMDMCDSFVIDGVTYQTVKNPNQITTGEFIDLNVLTQDETKIYENIPTLLAIFYRPVIDGKRSKDYDVIDVEERKKLFNEKLEVDKVFQCVSFFLSLKLIYLSHISQSSSKKMKKIK